MGKQKKKFKDTGFGKFIFKAKDIVPGVAEVALDAVGLGKVGDLVGNIGKKIESASENDIRAKELYNEFLVRKMEFERDLLEIEFKDRDSARKREVDIIKSGGRNILQNVVGYTILAQATFCIVVLAFFEIPEENKALFHVLLGEIIGAGLMAIIYYFFGSSKGSSEKNEILIEKLKQK